MKKLIVIVAALILCALILFFCLKKSGSDGENASSSPDNAPVEKIENVGENEPGANNAVVGAGKPAAGSPAAAGNAVAIGNTAVGGNSASAGNATTRNSASAGNATTRNSASAGNSSSEKNVSAQNSTGGKPVAVSAIGSGSNAQPTAVPATGSGSEAQPAIVSVTGAGSPDAQISGATANASASNSAGASENGAASASGRAIPSSRESVFSDDLSGPSPSSDMGNAPAVSGGADSYQYFEYQVITVPKKTLAEAAESMGLPKDSPPSNELLPAIYKTGGYRVIGYSAGYSAASTPVEFKMARTEFFPDFYLLPNDGSDQGNEDSGADDGADGGADEEDDDSGDENDDNSGDNVGDGDDEEDATNDDGFDSGDFNNSYNNLASILPFFGDPTIIGNEFFLDIRPPRFFSMESSLRKLNGFTNTDYGDWGTGQSPIFDDNSFSSMLTSTRGKPMIVAQLQTSNAWTLHVFFTEALPMPDKLVPAEGTENKLVRLDFQIVRAKWTDLLAAGKTDGCPTLPSDSIYAGLSDNKQLRDLYSPSFRLVPSQEPVSIQLNAKMQYVPLKWIPAQDYGVPAIPMGSEAIWTGTALRAAARVLNDGNIVRLDYRFEKVAQTGWRNYGYSFFGEPEAGPSIVVQQDRYARPQQQQQPAGPEILSGLLKLPMLDTTAFRQALYLEVGKPVLAARISNPAYQPDMLTLLFVTATVEDAP